MITPYFSDGQFTLFHGNTIDILGQLSDSKFDLIFSDPPYFLSNGTFTCQNGKAVSVKKSDWDILENFEEEIEFHSQWISLCKSKLTDSGTLWISGTYHSIYKCGFILQKLGFKILNDISWYKPNASPNLCCRYFTASHETLIWAKKNNKSKHIFNYDEAKNYSWEKDFLKKPNKQMRSVWSIATPGKSEKVYGKHPTQKPLELLERIILTTTKPGDIVLDPFTGSSTTGIAATKHGRKYVGIDSEKNYLDLSINRYKSCVSALTCSDTLSKCFS